MALNRGHTYRERIDERAAGRTLLGHLAVFTHATLAEWRARIEAGLVRLDGATASAEQVLRKGQSLTWARPPWEEPPVPLCMAVLHQDDDLLAVGKPRGLPTMPAGGVFLEHTLLAVVQRRSPEAVPMHRLGRGTSGIVLFARTAIARSAVQAAFRAHEVRKLYRALCQGEPRADAFAITAPIGEVAHRHLGTVRAAAADGKPSISHVRVLERRSTCSLVEVEIETGRPHQIRIHLAHAGHPLLGDPLYEEGGVPRADATSVPADLGYWLHARLLSLRHPRTGEPLTIECAPPPILRPQATAAGRPASIW